MPLPATVDAAPGAFRTASIDVAIERITGVLGPHRIALHGRGSEVDFRHRHAVVGGIGLNHMAYGRSLRTDIEPPDDRYFIVFALAGAYTAIAGRERRPGAAGSCLVISPGQPVSLEFAPSYREICVRLDRPAVDAALTRLLGSRVSAPVRFDPFPQVASGQAAGLRDLALMLADNRLGAGEEGRADAVSQRLEDLAATLLLLGVPSNYSARLAATQGGCPDEGCHRAADYIRRHARMPIAARDIVAASGLGRSALYAAFRQRHGVTPMEFLRDERLRLAFDAINTPRRRRVLVEEIALDCGFVHMGRFAAAYRARYGELPAAALRRTLAR